jgi:hypothetical protein
MAKIVLSEAAPSDETLAFSFAGVEEAFTPPFETDNSEALANAKAHPWLEVEYPEAAQVEGVYLTNQLSAADDHLSALNDHSNDPDAVAAELERRKAELEGATPLAVDAGLDQDEEVSTEDDRVNLTLAADEADPTTDDDGVRY